MASDGFDGENNCEMIQQYSKLPPSRMARQLMSKTMDDENLDDTTMITAKIKSPIVSKRRNKEDDWKNKIAI